MRPELAEVLDELDAYLSETMDVRDGSDGKQLPNRAMTLLEQLRHARRLNDARPEEERGFYTKQGVHSVSDGKRYCTDCNRELYSDGKASLLPQKGDDHG